MWRIAARCLVVLAGMSLSACMPGLPTLPAAGQPSPVSPFQALPTATATVPPSPTAVLAPTATATVEPTFTEIPTFTATGQATGTEATGTLAAGTPGTGTPPTALTGGAPTELTAGVTVVPLGTALPTGTAVTPQPISLDKLPPGIPYKRVHIENESRSQMDISLHCTTAQGLTTVLEYENVRNLTIQAPEGDYVYVVYVGGRGPIVGSFSLLHSSGVTITVYSDHVTVR